MSLTAKFGLALTCVAGCCAAVAAAPARAVDFEREIRPIFTAHCLKCHGPKQSLGGLRLDEGRFALAGGDSGKSIVPRDAAASELIKRITSRDENERMPAEASPLTAAQIALLETWIQGGASWPGTVDSAPRHWSLQPLEKPALPTGRPPGRNPVDVFVTRKLAEQRLTLSPSADRRTLIRRLSFDLIGLPPTPAEVARFVANRDPLAYEQLVDRLLASPRHGERWAQHWLDAVRFAESDGFETNKPRANAWPYRDYVIAAINQDLPYDQFIRQQLAGDVLGADAATGFLVGGANDVVKSPDPVLTAQQRADVLHDLVSTTAATFLGLTAGCARCHNHKFDPIPQTDYYALTAALAGVDHGERPLVIANSAERTLELAKLRDRLAQIDAELLHLEPLANPQAAAAGRPPVHPRQNVERFAPRTARRLRFTVHKTNTREPCLDELEVYSADDPPRNVALAGAGTKARASSIYPNSKIHRLEHINDGLVGNGHSWISNETGGGWVELEFARPERIAAVRWGRDREERYADRLPLEYTIEVAIDDAEWQVVASAADRQPFEAGRPYAPGAAWAALPPHERARARSLVQEQAHLEAKRNELSTPPAIYAGVFAASPPATRRLHRGDPAQPREEIAPGGLRAIAVDFDAGPSPSGSPPWTEDQRRRLALARWIVDPANPLPARVIVNRLWQQHFGEGLVATPSDFGVNGARPTHPQLLDWLAAELIEHGWSLRHIHRLIVTSQTYRQSSASRDDGRLLDAQCRLLWRYPPRRLEAEPLRDAVLAVSGQLDLRMGGPGYLPFEPNDNYVRVYQPKQKFGPADWRRMVYMTKIRMQQEGTFGAFDCPDGGQIAPRRSQSTTPLQALNLLNSPFLVEQAASFAERVRNESQPLAEAQVRRAFALAFQREPAAEELEVCAAVVRRHGLMVLCRTLLNSNEFLFVD